MKFVTVKELNKDIIDNLYKIPTKVDVIVGIPRSGMLVATLIALYMNKPLVDIDSFINHKIFTVGNTKNTQDCVNSYEDIKKVLIVEDSSYSGRSIMEAKEKLKNTKEIEKIYYATYVTSTTKELVDIFCEVIDEERVFEWNFMHHNKLINACVDIDGVLCIDPTKTENDDGIKYKNFLLNAKPKYIPTRKVGYLVTSRLEKYRKETEEWLKRNNIEYKELFMMNLDSAKERQKLGNHAEFKANIYKKIKDANWFIESESNQAKEINRLTGKNVFCVENESFYNANSRIKFKTKIKRNLKKTIKKVLPERVYLLIKKVKNNGD